MARALQVSVSTTFARLHLAVLPSYGNPDLFVNTNGRRPLAGPGQSMYDSSFYIGTDQIDISYTDLQVRRFCSRSTRPGATCTFNVGVYGVDHAGYVIIATVDGAAGQRGAFIRQ